MGPHSLTSARKELSQNKEYMSEQSIRVRQYDTTITFVRHDVYASKGEIVYA